MSPWSRKPRYEPRHPCVADGCLRNHKERSDVRTFRDAARLASATQLALVAYLGITFWVMTSDLLQVQMLLAFKAGEYLSGAAIHAASDANDARQRATGLVQFAAYVVAGLLILAWTWRANANARALGAAGMRFSPTWSVGWYFVPVANLVVPYLAMREIWRASADPPDWRSGTIPWFLPFWWIALLLTGACANLALRLSSTATDLDALILSSWFALASDAAGLLAGGILLHIIACIQRLQAARREALLQAATFAQTEVAARP